MKLNLTRERLVHGAVLNADVLTLPACGGGVAVNEIAGSGPRYLNFTVTVEEEHSMAMELKVYAKGEAQHRVLIRFGLMPRYRANICLDLNLLDGHILFPGHVPGELKVVCHGSRIDRDEIVRAELVNVPCFHDVKVKLEDIELADIPREPATVPDMPLIDEMGQYIPKEWPGKSRSVEELSAFLHKQAALPGVYPFENWTKWGGDGSRKLKEGTGFFSRVKKDDRWYLTDPDGCAFFSMGPDCVVVRCDARVDGIEKLCRWLPETDDPQWAQMYESMGRRWGEVSRGEGKLFSFERTNLYRAFGDGWAETWRGMIVRQLMAAGMNSLGNWSDATLYGRMPYVTSLPRFPKTEHMIFRDFPDVLSPEYQMNAMTCAQALAERRDDPWMIGYFLRNEPSWAFVDHLIIADEVLRDKQDTYCKKGLLAYLRAKYVTVEGLNAAWNTAFASFDDLEQPVEKASAFSCAAREDLRAYSATLIRAYTSIPSEACRMVDPNHMILGMRWAWISDPVLASGWDCFDVFSINCYAVDPTEAIEHVRELGVDLPVVIGEFHFGALDAGPTATGLEAVPTQAERGAAYRYYCERVAAHPNGVGCHYFQCYDQFALGRFDGENYNIGLFDITLKPYKDMMQAVYDCSENIYAIRAGEKQPTDRKPQSLPMIAY